MKRILILGVMCLLLCSCGDRETKKIEPGKINCSEMKELMEYDNKPILVDVRTREEFNEGHLDEAINLPVDSINQIDAFKDVNKETLIIVYCRSGQRSSKAKEELNKLGYVNVYDLGAMTNCTK